VALRAILAIIVAAAILWVSGFPVRAQPARPRCPAYGMLAAELGKSFGEAPIAHAFRDDNLAPPGGVLVEFYTNPDTGTWTMVQIAPDGTACITAAGQMWEAVEAKPGNPA
jgi:hypothetical protein